MIMCLPRTQASSVERSALGDFSPVYSQKLEMGFRPDLRTFHSRFCRQLTNWTFKGLLAYSRSSGSKNELFLFIYNRFSEHLNCSRLLRHVQLSVPRSANQTVLSAVVMLLLPPSTSPVRLLLQRTAHKSATACASVPVQRSVVQVHDEELTVAHCYTLLAYRVRLTAIIVAVVTALFNAAMQRLKETDLWHNLQ